MSSFIKKLLFISDGKNKSVITPTKNTANSSPNDGFVEPLLKECSFSSDDIGVEMSLQWDTFNSYLSGTNSEDVDLEHGKLKDEIFLKLLSFFIATYSTINNCSTLSGSDLNLVLYSQPKVHYEVTGHPTLFVLQVAIHLLDMLTFERELREINVDGGIGVGSADENRESGKAEINFHLIFPVLVFTVAENNEKIYDMGQFQTCYSYRTAFIKTLQCLSIVVSWPHNCTVLKNNLGKEFVKFFVQLMDRLVVAVDNTFTEWSDSASSAVESDTVSSSSSSTTSHRAYQEHSLEFAISCVLLSVQVVSRCGSDGSEREFGDLLPAQPWTLADLAAVAGSGPFAVVPSEEQTRRGSSVRASISGKPSYQSSSPSLSFLSSLAGKRSLSSSFVDAGVVPILLQALARLHVIISTAQIDVGTGDTDNEVLLFRVLRLMLVVQSEGLFLLNSLLAEHSAVAVDFCTSNKFLILNNILVSHPSKEFLRSDSRVEKLIVRRGVICLRLNTQLSEHVPQPFSVDCTPNYVSLLELPAICEFLFWVSQHFDNVDRYLGDILTEEGNSVNKLLLAVDFHDKFVSPSVLAFDLWPWQLNSGPDSDHTVLLGEECSYYHLMPQTASEHLKRRLMRALPGYVVWDSILAELVGSRSFSYLRPVTTTTVQPVSSSSSQKKRASKRNIYFVFVLFHQLFDEKLCQYGAASSRMSLTRSSREGGLPLCQIKFSEYICQLFKAAEPEDIFAIINDFELFEILFGEMFLLGGATLSKELLPLDGQVSSPPPEFPFVNAQVTTSESGARKLVWSRPCDRRGVQHCFWALLHDNVLDFFNGLVVYSLYFQTSTETVPSFVSFDDVIVLLVDFVLPALRLSGAETFSGLTTTVPSSIGYQVMLLLHNLSETISSLGDREKNVVRRKIVNKLLEFTECKLRRMNPLIGLLPSEVQGERKPVGDTTRITFEWLECYAAVSLLVRLTSMSVCGHTNWAEIFSVPTESDASYLSAHGGPDGGSASPTSEAVSSPMKLTLSPPKFLSRKKHVGTADANTLRAAERTSKDSLSVAAKSRIRSLMLLLLDARTRAAGIHIINDIIILCASGNVSASQSECVGPSTSNSEQTRDINRALNLAVVAEIVRAAITLISEAAQYSEQCAGFQTSVDLINALVWLLRSTRFIAIRKILQEIFRPFILDLMNALTTSMREFAEKNLRMLTRGGSAADKEVALFPLSTLLRQGIALLTSIVCGDEASKTELGVISQHSKENTEFTSHLFGNFRNIDKVKRLSAAAAAVVPASRSSSSSSARGTGGFENLKDLVLLAEKRPTRETIVVLFEMLLDGNCLLFDSLGGSQSSDGVSALFLSDEDRPKIKNVNIIPDIFGLVPHCKPANQSFILESFHNLITGRASLVNLNACSLSTPRVIDLALDLFPWLEDAAQLHNVTLLQSLGRHGISVAMLKHLFRVLQSKGEARPSFSWRVIQALQGMISEEDGPRQTFVFEGTNSGLKLPPIFKWPAQKAYSFCSWLKIEAPKLSAAKFSHQILSTDGEQVMLNVYSPYIVCLRNNGGAGLELYLRPSKIPGIFRVVLKIYSESGETSTLSPELKGMNVAEGRWHFLGFSVSSASFYNKCEACIQLDDQFVRHTFNSSRLPDSITEPLIGDCVAPLRMEGHNNTMRGQMGAFYFFSESLSEGQFRSIHALGPDYIYNFEPFSASYRDMSGSRKHHQRVDPVLSILDGSLTPHIILAYNPVVWKGELFLDNTPLKNDVRWKMLPGTAPTSVEDILSDGPGFCRMHARRLKGTYRSITQDVRLALNSLGGVKTVFPLFAQLDQPRISPSTGAQTTDVAGASSSNSSFDANFLPSILGLLINLLENNAENQAIFLRVSGFGVIAHLLERVSPEHFSSLTLDRLIELFNKLESNFALQENFLEHVLCHFKFWVFTPLAIQLRLFNLLGELISLSSQYLCEALSFQRLVDLLYLLYDYEPPHIDRTEQSVDYNTIRHSLSSGSAHSGGQLSRSPSARDLSSSASSSSSRHFLKSTIYSSDVWVRVDTGETVGVKLKSGDLFQVRSRIFSLLSGILQSNRAFLPEDVQALVLYLVHTTSPTTKVEVLSFLLNLLSNENSNFLSPHMLLGFAIGNAVKLFNVMYSHDDAQIRLLTLLLFCKVLTLSLDYKLLPDIPKASRYFKTGTGYGGALSSASDDFSASDSGTGSSKNKPHLSRDGAAANGGGDMPTFSDTFDALGLASSNMLSILLFIQEQLLSKQGKDSTSSRLLQNKVVAYALQLTMVGEASSFLLPVVMEAFGTSGGSEIPDERCISLTQALDLQFEEFQNHKLPSASLCVPMVFLSLVTFVDCNLVSLELRLYVLLNMKTLVGRSPKNCDRLMAIPMWYECVLRLMENECARHKALSSNNCDDHKSLSKSVAVREVCLRILSDMQTMAIRIGCTVEAAQIARHSASSSKELTSVEVVKCITRGDRLLGGTALIEMINSLRRMQRRESPASDLARSTALILLEKVVGALQQENGTLTVRSTEQSTSSDLIRDHAEKILHLNAWLTAKCLLDFVDSSNASSDGRNMETTRAALWGSVQEILRLLEPLHTTIPTWMFEEKSFRVQAGGPASPEQSLDKMSKLLMLPSARLRTHISTGGSPNSAKPVVRRLPISHAPGGLCWLTVRILCGLHLAESGCADQSSECEDLTFSICHRLKEVFRSAEKFPDFYEREAFYVISLLSEAMRTTDGVSRSEQWAISTIELVVELATSVKDTLLSMVADGSYEQSFSALSEHAPSSDRGLDSEDSRPSKDALEAAAAAALLTNFAPHELSGGYKVLLGSLSQLLALSEDEQSSADIWFNLMQKQLVASQSVDEAVMRFRLRELGISPLASQAPTASPIGSLNSKHQQRSEDKAATNEWFIVSQVWKSSCIEAQNARLRDWIKQLDSQSRRFDAKWTAIFTELANERGPWGYGAGDQREVFWMLDACETNLHVKMRMRRNEAGTRHLMAAQKSFGRHSHSTDSNLDLVVLGGDTSSGGIQGIYKDLKKYKKKQQQANKPFSQQGEVAEGLKQDIDEEEDGYSDLEDGSVALDPASASELTGADLNLVLFSCEAEVITAATNSSGGHTPGKVEVTKTRLSFTRASEGDTFDFTNKTGNSEFMWACQGYPSSSWGGEEICAVCERLYQMRHVAVELFFTSRTSVLLNLYDVKHAKKLCRLIRTRVRTINLNTSLGGRPKEAIARSIGPGGLSLTQAWMQHKITNFEYLMHLNITAGRTFNDLAQYPVFPWVLSDYTSPRIDLRDPKFFRNFQWPMGAQVDSQRQLLQEKYEASASLQDDEVLPYHTGSHYSTAAMVIWYLIRMEPFTSFHVWLQDGKFDRPDRLFHSIDSTWRGCTSNPQDVKELIPEFFFNPEFLENVNDISFGTRQNGRNIDNVDMPAWCKDASDFVRINREALESDYVSRNLHHWIDLVFGHKQRPPHLIGGNELAVDACNVFVHLTYPDAVNLEEIKTTDEVLYERTIRQIDNYGQTPVQLFDRAHPERLPIDRVDIIWPIASVVTGVDTMPRAATAALQQQQQLDKPSKVLCYGDFKVSASPVLLIAVCGGVLEKLVVVDSTRVIGYHGFQVRQPDIVPPFALKVDKSALLVSTTVGRGRRLSSYLSLQSSGHTKEKLAGVPFASHGVLSQSQQAGKLTACLSDFDYARIGTASNKASFLEEEHQSRVKSVENDRRFQHSKSVASSKDTSPKMRKSRSAVNLSSEMSGEAAPEVSSKTGAGGRQINRRERVDEHLSCNLYALLPDSKLLFSCAHWDNSFKVTAVDSGRLIQSVSHHREVVTCLAVASDFGRHWLVTGSKDCIVIVWELCPEKDNEPITPIPLHILYGHDDSVNCLAVSPELDLIVSGSDDGTVIIHTLREGTYLRSILIGISQSMYTKAVSSLLLNSGQKEPASPSPAKLSSSTSSASIASATSKRSATSKSHRSEIPQIYKRRVQLVVITKEGYLVTYSPDGNLLSTHTMNGRYVKMVDVKERIHAMCLSEDGKVLITGGERCLVVIRWVNNLTLANNGPRKDLDSVIDGSHDQEHAPFASPIRSLYLTAQERHLVVGLESGHIRILAQDSEYLRRKLHRKLMEIGILTF